MNNRFLTALIVCSASMAAFSGDSNRFTLNTLKANFLIMSFDSDYCRGAYNASRNDKAYFLADWTPVMITGNWGWTDQNPKVRFKAEAGSPEIIKYAFFINGIQQGEESASNIFELPLNGLSAGSQLTVCGIDKNGYRTPSFRANFDVISRPVWISGYDVASRFHRGTYEFGAFTASGKIDGATHSGHKSWFPTLSKTDKVGISFKPKFGYKPKFDSKGTAGFEVWLGTARDAGAKKRRRNEFGTAWNKEFAEFMGASFSASLDGTFQYKWDSNKWNMDTVAVKGKFATDIHSPTFRPAALGGIVYFKGELGIKADIGGKKSLNGEGDGIFDSIALVMDAAPYAKLTGGVGGKIGGVGASAQVSGTGSIPFKYDGGLKRASLSGAFDATISAKLYFININKEFALWKGEYVFFPANSKMATISDNHIAAFDSFEPLKERRRNTKIYNSPMARKGTSERILMADVPIESLSEIIGNNDTFYWMEVVDDTNRSDMNVSKVVLCIWCENSLVTEVLHDDGTNDFEPQLARLSNNELVAAWSNANRQWSENEAFSNVLRSLDIEVAVRQGNGEWNKQIISSSGNNSYDHMVSLASDGMGHAVVVWVRNSQGNLLASAECHDRIMYSTYENGMWSPESVLVSDAGRVYSGSLVCQNGGFSYVYSADETFNDDVFANREIYLVGGANGVLNEKTRLTNNSVEDDSPIIAIDENGTSVLLWTEESKVMACIGTDVSTSQIIWDASGVGAVNEPCLVKDENGHLKGMTLLASPTNRVCDSLEVLFAGYSPSTRTWDGMIALTDNTECEQYARTAYDGQGNLHLVFLNATNATSANDFTRYGTLKEIVYSSGCDIAINEKAGLAFDGNLQLGSNTQITVTLENNGLAMPSIDSNAWLRIYKGDVSQRRICRSFNR